MDATVKRGKQQIRQYLANVSDSALWQLAAMSKDGQVQYIDNCKCIRGIVGGGTFEGYCLEDSADACNAENGLNIIGIWGLQVRAKTQPEQDHHRNLRLLPIVRAEIRRRDRLAQTVPAERTEHASQQS
jgi:hypothetical protein